MDWNKLNHVIDVQILCQMGRPVVLCSSPGLLSSNLVFDSTRIRKAKFAGDRLQACIN
jgi:hypothetical protein